MEKIVIIGSPGAGKSTLARMLGEILGIEVFHLDHYFWSSDWQEKSIEARIAIQQTLIRGDKWIIEGTYLDSSDERLQAADTIIFLDISWLLCLLRVLRRRIEYHKKTRPDLPEGCTERIRLPYFLKVLVFPQRGRKLYFQKKEEIEKNQLHKEKKTIFYWLRSIEAVEALLRKQAELPAVQPVFVENQQKPALSPHLATPLASISLRLLESLCEVGASLSFAGLPPVAYWSMSNCASDFDTMR